MFIWFFTEVLLRSTVEEKEQKQLLMDLEVVMKSNDCPFIVLFYGAIFKVGLPHTERKTSRYVIMYTH